MFEACSRDDGDRLNPIRFSTNDVSPMLREACSHYTQSEKAALFISETDKSTILHTFDIIEKIKNILLT